MVFASRSAPRSELLSSAARIAGGSPNCSRKPTSRSMMRRPPAATRSICSATKGSAGRPRHFLDGARNCVVQNRYLGLTSGIELAGRCALLRSIRSTKRAEQAIQRGIADAKPVLLADEVMAQVILLDPASEARLRLIGNVGDVMHPFIMQDGEHHPEQR